MIGDKSAFIYISSHVDVEPSLFVYTRFSATIAILFTLIALNNNFTILGGYLFPQKFFSFFPRSSGHRLYQ